MEIYVMLFKNWKHVFKFMYQMNHKFDQSISYFIILKKKKILFYWI